MMTFVCILLLFVSAVIGGEDVDPALPTLITDFDVSRRNILEPIIFFITPTHKQYTQLVDLTRMSQFLQLSMEIEKHNIYWIIVEDRSDNTCSHQIRQLLYRTGLPFAHLLQASSKQSANSKYGFKSNKGINQRNHAMDIIEHYYQDHLKSFHQAILYFADADNAYDLRLVPELLQTTKGLSVFPVGFTANRLYERCLVDAESGQVTGFVGWRGGRKYPVDMAGFALTLKVSEHMYVRVLCCVCISCFDQHYPPLSYISCRAVPCVVP
jgi:hypothetical protein